MDGLLTFTRNGNNFEITANEEVSPAEFITVYGEQGYDQASTAIYSSDGTLESGPSEFAITVYYESSAYFDDADARAADQRFIFTDPLETYEGPTAGDDITINWSAAIQGTRTWGTGNPNNAIACRDTSDTATSHTWPSTGKEDSAQFDAPTTPTTNRSNTITPTFTNEPDFENPADQNSDNIYLVRFYNTHDLHNQTPESKNPSCSGSAADLQIKVKDVGTPEPIVLTADFNSSDNTKIDLSWPAPTGFVENGSTVTFPHTDFNPSSYDYRYRATSSDPWTEVTGLTGTPATITGLTQTSYDIHARAKNSEGASPWPTTFTTVTRSSAPDKIDTPMVSSKSTTSITIEWAAPNDNGSPITSYRVTHKKNADSNWEPPETTTSTSHTISNLEQGLSYDFKVRAINDTGRGRWSTVLTTNTDLPDPEGSIQTLTNSIPEGQSAQFQINLDRNASVTVNLTYSWIGGHGSTTGGTVTFSDSNSQALSLPTTSTGTAGSITVTVASGTDYTIGSPSSATVTINRQTTPPSTPAAPSLTPLSSTAIRALWQAPTSQQPITSYTVRYSVADANDWTETAAATTTADVTGLTVNTSYDVEVKAHNSDGTSSWSSTATASTKTLTATITSDQSSVTEGNAASFTVSLSRDETGTVALEYAWSGSHGSATGDTVSFSASNSETISIPTTEAGVNGSITVTIASSNAYSIGSPSSAAVTINRQTTPPSTPAAPSLTPLSSTAIRALWLAPTSQQPITSYTVRYSLSEANDWTEITAGTTTADITGLKVNTSYDVEVKAHSSDGSSGWSETETASTFSLTATIAYDQASVTEGDAASFTVALSRNESVTVALEYAWSGSHGSSTGNTIAFSASDSQTIAIPTTATGANGNLTVTITPSDAYTIGSQSSATVTISRQIPATLSLTALSSTAIRVSWQEPTSQTPITGYTLSHSLADANDWTELTITDTTADITGLAVDTSYDVEVKAHNSDTPNTWFWSATATVSTLRLTATITSDQASVTEGDAASFTVALSRAETVTVLLQYSWTGSHGTTTGDSITFSASDSETISIPTTTTGANGSITVAIGTNTAYTIGSPSSATATINRQTTPPSAPAAPSLTPLSSTSVRASWQAPTSQKPVTSYTLAYSIADENDWTEITSTGTSADITGLTVNTAYDFQLKAHNSDGASRWSATAAASTLNLIATITSNQPSITEGNPAIFTISLSRDETVTVALEYVWSDSHGTATRNTVTFSSSDSQTISIPTTATGTDGNLTVAISPSNAYTIGTPSSESVTINRQISPPSRPAPPSLTPLSSTSIRATWQTPTSQQPLTRYTLRYRVTGNEPWTEELKTGNTSKSLFTIFLGLAP